MRQKLLSELVEERISLGRESSGGFRQLRCQVCNDHSERAGFKLDGELVGYNCFNCGSKFTYEEGSGKFSRNARRILDAFGITQKDLDEVAGSAFFNKSTEEKVITLESLKPQITLFTPEVKLPPASYPLGSPHNEALQLPLIEYLVSRSIDPLRVFAHFSTDPKFLRRVILPCMRENKVIFWQARTIDDVRPRYLSPSVPKEAVMWGYDNIWKHQSAPLFVTEGIFDAEPLEGVAILGSTVNDSKLEVLTRSRRQKIVVIDRDDNGEVLGEIALKHGWQVSFVDRRAKDVNDSVRKFGAAFTIWSLMQNRTVPSKFTSSSGMSVKSELELKMQLALAKLGRK